ncbi:telomere repeats-binding bouquet formation protein 1 isoform X2 [Periophthalmus magnuspinnatus]|uniref:telomere repeats-binding bouquet formation protein 1 isoform X2 n=1 Tax=Periophthalmus magnuspinnatus TaxID=409849 RepID=UPI0024372FD9|nr:telomere repeats-binding bouquet formation protein 1 isoform X2 [Periophthalmus magnuspinnatus]
MDTSRAVGGSCPNTIRTDLSLLLECLKFQMKCPDLQKQALLTIHSICEKREHNVELLREMGGVAFLLNLSKSSIVRSDVAETSLFTLSTLAEANVYCKSSLSRKEIFTDLADWLVTEDAPLTKKRVIVYFLSVVVSNNKLGQILAQNTGCLDILLSLFRATFPLSPEDSFKTASSSQLHQLWSSVSSALCGCVNNPQNEEGQRACVTVFPTVKNWFQQISLPQTELFQPICSFIAMTVTNNSCVQESFAAAGGLENLTLALIRFCLQSETSLLACQLAVSTSKTLSACISDNTSLASDLAKYGLVFHLFSLLINPKLESEERLSVLLTVGHCTEASEEHQKQLVQIGSLPVIITLLTEDTSEEVRKAATFILQTCKQATNNLGCPDTKEKENKKTVSDINLDNYRKSAEALLHRIGQLEKKQMISQRSMCVPFTEMLPEDTFCESDDEPLIVRVNRNPTSNKMKTICKEAKDDNVRGENPRWSKYNSTRTELCDSNGQWLEGARELQENDQTFKVPVPIWPNIPKDICPVEDLRNERNNPGIQVSISDVRCKGCVLRFDEVNSRTFSSLQSSCTHSCDMHRVLKEATKRYISHQSRLFTEPEHPPSSTQERTNPSSDTVTTAQAHKKQKNWRDVSLTPIKKPSPVKCFHPAEQWKKNKDVRLTPLHKRMKTTGPAFCQRAENTAKGRSKPFPDDHSDGNMKAETCSNNSSQRRKRQDFSHEEELYLLCGVKTYGPSWNAILWSYPFQRGRTNVDLAKKYQRLMKAKGKGLS